MDSERKFSGIKKFILFVIFAFFLTNEAKSSVSCAEPNVAQCGYCASLVTDIYNACVQAETAATTAAANLASGVKVANVDTSMTAIYGSEGSTAASGGFANDCNGKTMRAHKCVETEASQPTPTMAMNIPACQTSIQTIGKQCQAKQASAVDALAKLNQTKEAFGSMLSKAAPYALVGLAAGGLGYLAGKGGKKGGGGDNNTPEVKTPESDKLPPLVLNSSSSSSSAGPNIVYFDKPTPNNNGALGNPAVTSSSTTSKPSDTVTVASITPSSSFGSDQKSLSTGSDPAPLSRTLSGSTGNTSLGGASGDSMDGFGPEGSGGKAANGTLVDGSNKGSGGGTAFMGGMDGSGGGNGNGQGTSADGTMLTGVLSGASNDPKKRALSNKSKNQRATLSAQQQQKILPSAGSRRGVANANRQATQAVKSETLVEFMTRKNLIRNTPKQLQK